MNHWSAQLAAAVARPGNLLDCQARAAVAAIDRELAQLHADDPTHYYAGDFDELLERRRALSVLLNSGPRA